MRALLVVLLASSACARVNGSGVPKTETRSFEPFTAIALKGGLELETVSGPAQLTLSGDDNLLALVETTVVNGCLFVSPRQNVSFSPSLPLRVTVSAPTLHRLSASGASSVELNGATDRQLELVVEGGASLVAKALDLDALQVSAKGGSHLELAGQARHADLEFAGGVDAQAKGLSVAHAVVAAAGGSSVELTVTEAIAGSASGGSDATVGGSPPRRHLVTSGGSDVTYLD